MITSAKNYTKKTKQNKQTNKQKKTKNGQSEPQDKWQKKAIQTKSHKEVSTYTLTKREKGKKKKNIYI